MRTGALDLDDVEELIAADSEGQLHAAALSGAQVRAMAEAVREGVTMPLAQLRPRSVVIVCPAGSVAAAAAALFEAMIATRIDVPVVSAPALPGWVGPLDVVVIAGDDPGDLVLADAALRAQRRRAEVVMTAPLEGPMRDAMGGNGIDLSPRIDVDARFRFAGYVAALTAVIGSLSQVRFTGQQPDLAAIADALDAEAGAGHPGRETFRNRAKTLAGRLSEERVVWSGETPATLAVAARASRAVLSIAGNLSAVADLPSIGRVWDRWTNGADTVADSIFYDPQIDGPADSGPPRVLVVTTAAREWQTQRRIAAFATAEAVLGHDEASADDAEAAQRQRGSFDDVSDSPTDLTALLVLLVRVELAAVYLNLSRNGRR